VDPFPNRVPGLWPRGSHDVGVALIVDLSDYSGPLTLHYDVCIVGAGAAGLSVALQFIGQGKRVVVLEGGGLELSEESQNIYQGSILGRPYHDLDGTRLRYLGGTTNHWGGWCRPLDSIDFQHRVWIPYSGWPITKDDLDPYLKHTCEILNLGKPEFSQKDNPPSEGSYLALNPDMLVHCLWRGSWPTTRFKDKYHETLSRADNVHVFLHANVKDIVLSKDHRQVQKIQVLGPGNKKLHLSAQAFVLALGGLENPRLLLNANTQIPQGVGNQHDVVGRFFMEHPEGPSARILLHESWKLDAPYQWFSRGVIAGIRVSDSYQKRLQLLNYCMTLEESDEDPIQSESSEFDSGVQEVMKEAGGTEKIHDPKKLNQHGQVITAWARPEHAPNPDSRVTLTDEVDRLGLRRIGLDWRLTELDQRTIRVANELLAKELGRLGIGRVWLPEWLQSDSPTWSYSLFGANHHMGTTRMANDPRNSVVDKDCRVHGLENLFIAGSSVFPTGGSANPTFTITQLALRLADHLKQVL